MLLLSLLLVAAGVYVARGCQDSGVHLMVFLILDVTYVAATWRSRA